MYLSTKIFLFSKETRKLDSIVAKHEKLSSLRMSLEDQNYYCLENYTNEYDQLVMTVSYMNERPFVDAVFMLYDLNFRITPAWFVVYADKNENILETEHAGGIVF